MERFVVNIENEKIDLLKDIANNKGITISWILREILQKLNQKKYLNLAVKYGITRPHKFKSYFSPFSLCFYGDKKYWLMIAASWGLELGPLLRYGIDLFLSGNLVLDFECTTSVKKIKNYKNPKNLIQSTLTGYIYKQHIKVEFYNKSEYWPKNVERNTLLMLRGLANRSKPRKYGKILL